MTTLTMNKTLRQEPTITDRGMNAIPLNFTHFDRMLTCIGIWQHSEGDFPNARHGYSIDDEARGLIVGLRYWERGLEASFHRRVAAVCFEFLRSAAILSGPDAGRYHNFCDAQGEWLDSVGSEDSFGRTLWGLGIACAVNAPFAPAAEARLLMERSLPAIDALTFLRAKAFTIIGLEASRLDDARLRALADEIADSYERTAGDGWHWFENDMTYCNARLPMAMFLAAKVFPDDPRYARIGAESLDFLLSVMRADKGAYAPIGNAPLTTRGWFCRGEAAPPRFDQQPVDAGALVEACVEGFHVTGEPRFRQAARDAFGWYLGDNVHGLPVYNPQTGGVADALTATGLNRNQGAESVLSFHLAYQALQTME
jgi:hypothetical protein